MSEEAFLAGVIEGEGSIQIRNKPKEVRLIIGQALKNRALLDYLHQQHGGQLSIGKDQATLSWGGRSLRPILRSVRMWLITKRVQANLALEYIDRMPGKGGRWDEPWRSAAVERMKSLHA